MYDIPLANISSDCRSDMVSNMIKVNVLYAHRADPSTPLTEQIQNFNEQIVQGRCKAVSRCASVFVLSYFTPPDEAE